MKNEFSKLVAKNAPAKDLADCACWNDRPCDVDTYVFEKAEFDYFCKQLLKEQRQKCYDSHWDEL